MRVRRRVDRALACRAVRSQPWGGGGLALLVFMTFWGPWVVSSGFRMRLVMLGAPVLLLGSLVFLVVCSGINDRVNAPPAAARQRQHAQ